VFIGFVIFDMAKKPKRYKKSCLPLEITDDLMNISDTKANIEQNTNV